VAIEELIRAQTLNPDFIEIGPVSAHAGRPKTQPIVRSFLSVVHGYREDI
jgi:hypothetical protein